MTNSEQIKVLILFSSSNIGGAERSLSRMALSNNNSMISYKLSTFGSNGTWSKWVSNLDEAPICFNHRAWRLVKYIYSKKPDTIYIIGFRLSLLLRLIKVFLPKVNLVQGVRWNPNSNVALDRVFRFTERFLDFLLDGYIVNSISTKQTISKLVNKKVEIIYNGISHITKNSLDEPSFITIITVANLTERKGHQDYLKAINIIIRQFPECRFIFLGKDNLNGKIQKNIIENSLSNNVQYLGFHEKVDEYLESSSIFVLPSLYGEGCPTSILEAFTFSVPVVAYKIDGIPELVDDGIDGLLFQPGNFRELAKGIISLLSNPEKIRDMGASGKRKVEKHFMLDEMVKKHNTYFLRLK